METFLFSTEQIYVIRIFKYNGFKYGDWSPTRIRLAPGRITNDGSDLEQQGSE